MHVTGLRQATEASKSYRNKFEKEALAAFRQGAKQITEWEKGNHPWQNRTFQAEKRIKCIAYREGTRVIMDNGHYAVDPQTGFKYGISLEDRASRKFNGRFMILQVALRRWWSWTIQQLKDNMSSA